MQGEVHGLEYEILELKPALSQLKYAGACTVLEAVDGRKSNELRSEKAFRSSDAVDGARSYHT